MKIYNLGSLNIDYVYSVEHIVTPKETLASSSMQKFAGGKGLNQSVALARAGSNVIHGGIIGADGEFLKDVLIILRILMQKTSLLLPNIKKQN